MHRSPLSFKIRDLQHQYPSIEFPEYQREPTVWNLEQKQRLIDSILRNFDIAAIYLYERKDGTWECIDGRQRLNAIMAFLGENSDDGDNGFGVRIQNEVADEDDDQLRQLEGKAFADLDDKDAILDYEVITVVLSGTRAAWEFNLQFLRLNLGVLINAGEKLHAMVGVMRDRIFEPPNSLGEHPFLAGVRIPTRRYSRQLLVAQVMLHVAAQRATHEFARARHFDLQRYLKQYADREDPELGDVRETLNALQEQAPDLSNELGNRAIAVSVILAGWTLKIRSDTTVATNYVKFVRVFLQRLEMQRERMKALDPDHNYEYLIDFQRNLTQAAVEKPAVTYRHRTLLDQFEVWRETGELSGDSKGEDAQAGHS